MATESKTTGFYAKLVAAGAGLALVAGLITNSRTVFDAVCRFVPGCTSSPYRFEGSISEFSEAAQLRERLFAMGGKVGYFDLGIQEPVFDSKKSLDDGEGESDGADEGQPLCVHFFEKAPSSGEIGSASTTYCAPREGSSSTFAPEKAYLFTWSGYYSVSAPKHMGQGHWQIDFAPLDPKDAILTMKQQ